MENWTPLHTRIIAHRVGDGSVSRAGQVTWNNKQYHWMLELADQIGVRLGKPVFSSCGTAKITIPRRLVNDFGNAIGGDGLATVRDSVALLRAVAKLGRGHGIQALAALMVDDGECSNDLVTLFESEHRRDAEAALELWEAVVGGGFATINDAAITRNDTRIYHAFIRSDGIARFAPMLAELTDEYGPLAGLWFKDAQFQDRYRRATSPLANAVRLAKRNHDVWLAAIVTFTRGVAKSRLAIQDELGVGEWTARRLIGILLERGEIAAVGHGKNTLYLGV